MVVPKEILEAALDSFPEGIGLIGEGGKVLYWNRAAEAITGFPAMELIGRDLPNALVALTGDKVPQEPFSHDGLSAVRAARVSTHDRQGQPLMLLERLLVLRNELGARIGQACVFHADDQIETLPHGEYEDDLGAEMQQAEFEEKLATVYEDYLEKHHPYGLLWITIDQAAEMRRTHGANACRNMIAKVEHALALGLRPGEQIARWGDDEFLVISFERTADLLEIHAQTLAGLARTADFQWWGDRVTITVSIGAAQASQKYSLAEQLNLARSAMESSMHAGGNKITRALGGAACLPS